MWCMCVVKFYRLEQLTAIDIWAIASLYSEKFQNFRISAQIFFFSLSSAISTEGHIHKFSQGPSHTQQSAHSTAYSRAYSRAQRKNWKFFSDANGRSSETPALLPVQGIATEKLCLSLAVRSLCALAPSQYKVSIGPCAVCSYVLGGGAWIPFYAGRHSFCVCCTKWVLVSCVDSDVLRVTLLYLLYTLRGYPQSVIRETL